LRVRNPFGELIVSIPNLYSIATIIIKLCESIYLITFLRCYDQRNRWLDVSPFSGEGKHPVRLCYGYLSINLEGVECLEKLFSGSESKESKFLLIFLNLG